MSCDLLIGGSTAVLVPSWLTVDDVLFFRMPCFLGHQDESRIRVDFQMLLSQRKFVVWATLDLLMLKVPIWLHDIRDFNMPSTNLLGGTFQRTPMEHNGKQVRQAERSKPGELLQLFGDVGEAGETQIRLIRAVSCLSGNFGAESVPSQPQGAVLGVNSLLRSGRSGTAKLESLSSHTLSEKCAVRHEAWQGAAWAGYSAGSFMNIYARAS